MLSPHKISATNLPIHPARIQSVANASILVVDDDTVICKIITSRLNNAGFTNVYSVNNGTEAVAEIIKNQPDLVILDLFMPGMDGLEVCRALKDISLEHPPSILIQTASTNDNHLAEAFSLGAADYIVKPSQEVDLAMRVITHLERRGLEIKLANERNRMRLELNEASEIQYSLLPSDERIDSIRDTLGIDIAANVTFSSELGGDLWGAKCIGKHHACIYTLDMVGHGLRAAMQAFRIHALIQDSAPMRSVPSSMLSLLNNKLASILPTGQFATMCYTLLDTELRTLTYSTAAAPLPMIIRNNGELLELEGSGLPLSCMTNHIYEQHQVTLLSGDTVIIHSDALFEVIPKLTEEKVVDLVLKQSGSAQDIVDNLMVEILHHLGNSTIQDDLTLVAIKIP